MVAAELLFGAEISAKPESNKRAIQELLSPLCLLPFGGDAVEHYAAIRADLQRKGNTIGANDLVIAATARAIGHTLVTRNTIEFLRVPALAVEQW
jgi:tRNA(fMet)-specific endonuclease VapC